MNMKKKQTKKNTNNEEDMENTQKQVVIELHETRDQQEKDVTIEGNPIEDDYKSFDKMKLLKLLKNFNEENKKQRYRRY